MKNLGAEYENLDQKIYQVIKQMIEDRELLPGQKIPQEKIAGELGVSRTPLISALKFLEHEKLVESKPRRGYFVRLFTRKEMISIFEIREVLEGLAARKAAMNITDAEIKTLKGYFKAFRNSNHISDIQAYSKEDKKFHTFITRTGSKELLTTMLQTFNIISLTYQNLQYEGLIREPNETIKEHIKIIDAICSRDSDRAEQLMRQHFQKGIERLKQQDDKQPMTLIKGGEKTRHTL